MPRLPDAALPICQPYLRTFETGRTSDRAIGQLRREYLDACALACDAESRPQGPRRRRRAGRKVHVIGARTGPLKSLR